MPADISVARTVRVTNRCRFVLDTNRYSVPSLSASQQLIMGFVFTHCAPWPEVVRASFNDQGFRESALIFCGGLTPADFQTAFKRLEEQSRELEAAQVETMGDIGGKKPLPATNQAS